MNHELTARNIERAWREAETKKKAVSQGKMRQRYHFMPQTGWMNDPNGLIYFQGKYHYYYQFNPYEPFWGSMYWGHAVSDDLLHWDYLPPALAPGEPYDNHPQGGCFSGSTLEYEGRLYAVYTSSANFGKGLEQVQCLAYSDDGNRFEKYDGNPILTAPEGIPSSEFRDPKVWRHGDFFYMVVGASRNGRGEALLYRSGNLKDWEFINVLSESRGEWGSMWECPDFFPLGGRYALTFSPVGSGDHTSVCLTGDFDYRTGRFVQDRGGEMDWGFDYYAPQSFRAPDGRRITVAWANGWQWMPDWKDWGPTYREGWCGFFALPREIRMLEDGTVQYRPIRELSALRTDAVRIPDLRIAEEGTELFAGDGVSFEQRFDIDLEHSDAEMLEIEYRSGGGRKTLCRFDFGKNELSVDRNRADGWGSGISRSVMHLCGKKTLDVDVFSDQSSLEIFTDRCRNNHSSNVFAGNEQNRIIARAKGGNVSLRNYESYGMKDCFRNADTADLPEGARRSDNGRKQLLRRDKVENREPVYGHR